MGLKVSDYDMADYLDSSAMIHEYLKQELDEDEPPYLSRALAAVARARGGVDKLAAETGVDLDALVRATEVQDDAARAVAREVMKTFAGEQALVA